MNIPIKLRKDILSKWFRTGRIIASEPLSNSKTKQNENQRKYQIFFEKYEEQNFIYQSKFLKTKTQTAFRRSNLCKIECKGRQEIVSIKSPMLVLG